MRIFFKYGRIIFRNYLLLKAPASSTLQSYPSIKWGTVRVFFQCRNGEHIMFFPDIIWMFLSVMFSRSRVGPPDGNRDIFVAPRDKGLYLSQDMTIGHFSTNSCFMTCVYRTMAQSKNIQFTDTLAELKRAVQKNCFNLDLENVFSLLSNSQRKRKELQQRKSITNKKHYTNSHHYLKFERDTHALLDYRAYIISIYIIFVFIYKYYIYK